ncbi:putative coatomer zeta subunit [Trypanosoma vivax]|nr:putative coatomer zeta subunit [Trypanosoma vivax]
MDFMHRVQAVVILNDVGERVFTKYYVNDDMKNAQLLTTTEKQRTLEMAIHAAVQDPKYAHGSSQDVDIMIYGDHVVLTQTREDVTFAVVGNAHENELVLYNVLCALVDALQHSVKSADLTVRLLLEKYDVLVLTVDEIIDEGIIFDTNARCIADEVAPFVTESTADVARKALNKVNKYLKENL